MTTRDELYKVLQARGSFEVVHNTVTPKQLRLLGRIDKARFDAWILIVHQLLTRSSPAWACDVSKQYIAQGTEVRHGWRLIFQAPNIDAVLPDIIAAINQTKPPAAVELQDQLLPGYRDGQIRGGVNSRGKGVSTPTNPMVGPRAVSRINNGGF
jgi:hypothetical protein